MPLHHEGQAALGLVFDQSSVDGIHFFDVLTVLIPRDEARIVYGSFVLPSKGCPLLSIVLEVPEGDVKPIFA